MSSNFVDLKQAAAMLGVSADQLVEMRSQGDIFGFRDGSSWKFKIEELERVAQERGISLEAPSDDDLSLGGDSDLDLDLSKPLFGEDDSLAPDAADASSLGDLLAGEDLELDLGDDEADSLLVSEDVPLVSTDSGASTIIGASNSPDSDLQLTGDDDDDDVLGSDLTLAGSQLGGSSILGDEIAATQATEKKGSDIASESDDLLVGPEGSGIGGGGAGSDDLELSLGGGTGDLELSTASGTGELELDLDSGLQLDDDLAIGEDDDDDLVLGDSSVGSDVTLGSGDTGINLNSASDSGLSLEEDPIEFGSVASSLELPDEEIISLEEMGDPDAATQLKQDVEFRLSPGAAMEDDDSASQVIALEDSAALDPDAATLLGDNAFSAELQPQMHPQPQMTPAAGMQGMAAPLGAGAAVAEMPREAPYSIWNVLTLMLITGILGLSGMLMIDVVRNMWSWESGASVSTSIMEGLLNALSLR